MNHTPAPELDADTIEAAEKRLAAMNLSADKEERNAIKNDLDREPTPPPKPTKPERKTITVDLTDCPEVYARIKQLADADDRAISMWVKRYLRDTIPDLTA